MILCFACVNNGFVYVECLLLSSVLSFSQIHRLFHYKCIHGHVSAAISIHPCHIFRADRLQPLASSVCVFFSLLLCRRWKTKCWRSIRPPSPGLKTNALSVCRWTDRCRAAITGPISATAVSDLTRSVEVKLRRACLSVHVWSFLLQFSSIRRLYVDALRH